MTVLMPRSEAEDHHHQFLAFQTATTTTLDTKFPQLTSAIDVLTVANGQLHDRMICCEAMLNTKLDKHELSQLQGLVAKVMTYEDFKATTQTFLEQHRQVHDTIDQRLGQHGESLAELATQYATVAGELAQCGRKKDLYALAKEVKVLQSQVPPLASKQSVNEVT